MLPPNVIGAPMALALGFAFGMGPCLVTCLPYLAPVFLGGDGGVRRSWRILLPLSLGRLCGYAALGAASGYLGRVASDVIDAAAMRAVLGAASLLVGVALTWRARGPVRCATSGSRQAQPLRQMVRTTRVRDFLPIGLFVLGVGMAVNPCAPLGVVLFSAAAAASASDGAGIALAFGVGALVVPSLVYGFGAAYFGEQLRARLGAWRAPIERAAAALLVINGLVALAV
jgi:sulfite exporter TauE/SafE